MRELKRIIKNDMDTMAGKIVYPPTSLAEAALAGRVLHAIDERLDILQFDIVAEGKFTDFTGAGIAVSDYTFSGNDGYKLTNVAVSPATLMPYYGYQENFDDIVRIFLRRVTSTDTNITRHFVIKLLILQDNSSSPQKTLLPKSWSS